MSFIVITGPPGAGKTTIAARLARSFDRGVHLVGDQCFRWIASGYVPPWREDATPQNFAVMGAIGAAARCYLTAGFDVVVDAIVGPWFLSRVQQSAGVALNDLHYVILRPSREVALGRALGRQGDALVNAEPIGSMYGVFEHLGTFESHVFDSTALDAAATAEAVAAGVAGGRYFCGDDDRPDMERLADLYGIEVDSK